MLGNTKAFSGFSVDDLDAAKRFYGDTLGVQVSENDAGLTLHVGGDLPVFIYPKDDHEPATFTILNFQVDDVEGTVAAWPSAASSSSATKGPRSRPTSRASSAARARSSRGSRTPPATCSR